MSIVMAKKAVSVMHVPDVRAILQWYEALGFTVRDTYEAHGELRWALLAFGGSELMFQVGGHPSTDGQRDSGLYLYVDDVDALYRSIKDRVEVVVDLEDTAYGMREFIIRDPNKFWVTLGQPIASG